jgi:hypothetical protein
MALQAIAMQAGSVAVSAPATAVTPFPASAASATIPAAATTESTPPAPATTTAEATPATTAGAFFLGPGFVDSQGATVVLLAVECGNCRLGFAVAGHFDKPKPLAAARVAIVDDLGRNHRTVSREQLFQGRAVNIVA